MGQDGKASDLRIPSPVGHSSGKVVHTHVLPSPEPTPSFVEIRFCFRDITFYNANQCVPRRHENKRWSEWATFEDYWYALEYKEYNTQRVPISFSIAKNRGWLNSRVVKPPIHWRSSHCHIITTIIIIMDSGAEGPGFKSQPRRSRVTVIGKLFTPIVPLFTKQQNW